MYPLVERDEASAGFFDAAKRGELQMKRAQSGAVLPPHARTDPNGASAQLQPFIVSGEGVLVSWAVVHQASHPALASAVPYVSALVELAEGPWLIVRLLSHGAGLRSGARVRARFEPTGSDEENGEVVPVFELMEPPVQAAAGD